MNHELNFWVVGGDMRQLRLAQLLSQDGHTVHVYALDAGGELLSGLVPEDHLGGLARADCVVLPLTVSLGDGLLNAPLSVAEHPLAPILDRLSPRQFLCGGRVDPDTRALAQARGLTIHDYFAREELAVANAVPTAEGAVQLAMEHLPITIHGSRVLVLGFGRVGRITAQRFAALGARVSVAARKYDQLAWAQAMGFDCLILDLASKPGGADQTAAGELGLAVIWALALPGKVAPVTAGAAIQTAIYNMLQELGR